jgi:hypothetical protein
LTVKGDDHQKVIPITLYLRVLHVIDK